MDPVPGKLVLSRFGGMFDFPQFVLYLTALGALQRKLKVYVFDVGSGIGIFIKFVTDAGYIAANYIVGIDPDPTSYNKPPILVAPRYKTVDQFLRRSNNRNVAVGKSILCLIRPTPSAPMSPSDIGYDIDAIRQLLPSVIFILYCADGSDCSNGMHHFLKKFGMPNGNSYGPDSGLPPFDMTPFAEMNYVGKFITWSEILDNGTNGCVATCAILVQPELVGFIADLPTGEINPNAPPVAELKKAIAISFDPKTILSKMPVEMQLLMRMMMGNL